MVPSADLLRDPKAAWSPWRPTDSDPWDEGKAAHHHDAARLGDIGTEAGAIRECIPCARPSRQCRPRARVREGGPRAGEPF